MRAEASIAIVYGGIVSGYRVTLVSVKDPLPTLKQRNVVYHIPRSGSPNPYVGQTGRQLSTQRRCPSSEKGPPGIHAILVRHGTQPPHASIGAEHSISASELYATIDGDEGKCS